MQYGAFIKRIQEQAGLGSHEDAERAAQATLQALGQRLTENEAANLAAQLPTEAQQYLLYPGAKGAVKLSLDQFYNQIAMREGTDPATARQHAQAVIAVLNEAVTTGEMDEVRAQLPNEFAPLFESSAGSGMSA